MESFNHWTSREVFDLGYEETLWLRNRANLRKGKNRREADWRVLQSYRQEAVNPRWLHLNSPREESTGNRFWK